MISNDLIGELISSPTRHITMGASLYEEADDTYIRSWTHEDEMKSVQIERVGEGSKFFGFGVIQKANLKVMDINAAFTRSLTDTYFRVNFKIDGYDSPFYSVPDFYVTEVHRDENTGELSITAYDKLYRANSMLVSEIALPAAPYTLKDVVAACASALDVTVADTNVLNAEFTNEINVEGTETVRELLDDIAEASQSIYWLDQNSRLYFRILNNTNSGRTITKEDYFTLKSGDNRRLTTIYKTTELGDDVFVNTGQIGTTQYIRDNVFWELAENIDTYLDNAIARVGNLTINQFDCSWRGDFRLQIGDKLDFITKNGTVATSYLLNDTMSYDGTFSQKSSWQYEDNDTETADNPTTLGETLKKTYAKVDKVNKQIDLVVSETDANSEEISAIKQNTDSISATVSDMKTNTEMNIDNINDQLGIISNKVEATMTAEEVEVKIQTALDNGVDRVETSTGFVFDETGLTVSKSSSEMTTQITEDGMTVYRENELVLTADNEGVKAEDLHATTYLIVGKNSRFEDYAGNRTGCFWIGE